MLSTLILSNEVPEMTLLTRTNNNVHADMYDTRTISAAEYIPMDVYCTILLWVSEIFRISLDQNKRQ